MMRVPTKRRHDAVFRDQLAPYAASFGAIPALCRASKVIVRPVHKQGSSPVLRARRLLAPNPLLSSSPGFLRVAILTLPFYSKSHSRFIVVRTR